jgi:hypothetical protein
LAFAAFLFWFWILTAWGTSAREAAEAGATPSSSVPSAAIAESPETTSVLSEPSAGLFIDRKSKPRRGAASFKQLMLQLSRRMPYLVFPLLWMAKGISLVVYLVQLPISYLILRLDYQQRWYLVTDRSLRLRSGVWSVREMTMSFANVQQITMSQGPLQRLLGIADVCVQSAGGGGVVAGHPGAHHASLHTGVFHAVDNAQEIRDLVVERLRQFRETGLGDPDESLHGPPAVTVDSGPAGGVVHPDTRMAARELLDEIRRLRASQNQSPLR